MIIFFSDFKDMVTCLCGEIENMVHIYNCEFWNETKNEKTPYSNIYNGNIEKQIEVYRIFEQNLERRNESFKKSTPT